MRSLAKPLSERHRAQAGIGGTLGDVGTHCVNLREYVTGDPITALCADKSTFLPDRRRRTRRA